MGVTTLCMSIRGGPLQVTDEQRGRREPDDIYFQIADTPEAYGAVMLCMKAFEELVERFGVVKWTSVRWRDGMPDERLIRETRIAELESELKQAKLEYQRACDKIGRWRRMNGRKHQKLRAIRRILKEKDVKNLDRVSSVTEKE